MNGIKGTKPAGRQWNKLLYAVVTIIKYKKSTIYHAIYIKFFSGETVSHPKVSTYYFLNNNNNKTAFIEITRFFEEHF